MNALNEIGPESFKTDLIQCGFFRFHPDSFGSVGGLRPSSEGEYLQKFCLTEQPQTFQPPQMLCAGGQQINPGGLNGAVAQNIR